MKKIILALVIASFGAAGATAQTTNTAVNAQEQERANNMSPVKNNTNPVQRNADGTVTRQTTTGTKSTRTTTGWSTQNSRSQGSSISPSGITPNHSTTKPGPLPANRANSSNSSTTIRPDDVVK